MSSSIHELIATVRAPAFALSRTDGQIVDGMQGLFVDDVRVLAQAELRVDGLEPQALATLSEGPGRTRFITAPIGLGDDDPDPTVRLERMRTVAPDGLREEIRLRSTAAVRVRAELTIDLRCDLTPVALARAGQGRPSLVPIAEPGRFTWSDGVISVMTSADDTALATANDIANDTALATANDTAGSPDPRSAAGSARLRWSIDLPPRGEVVVWWSARVAGRQPTLTMPHRPVEWSRPVVTADEPRLARLVARSLDDLATLRLAEAADPHSTFLGAGVPWFLTLFGRDSLWAARMMLPLGTDLAEGTLRVLARRQGLRVDVDTGEAPGKIMHELRRDDLQRGRPGALPPTYYGTVDATLLWISLLAEAWRWGMPDRVVTELLPHLSRALSWMDRYADPDQDGFVEYIDRSGRGLSNQGWKDSGGAVRFHDGTLARPPIALCEVQGYAHRAALDAAELLDAVEVTGSQRWRDYAATLADRFRARFWVRGPLGPQPALAIAGDGRAVDSLTSNIGHLLGTGILSPDEETTVAELLADPVMSGGHGLRTMSTLDAGYAPLSYHCGSIWPHDTAIALLGLAYRGADQAASTLLHGLLVAAESFDYRLPELFGGDGRDEVGRPVPYAEACRPQAWSAAAAIVILQAALGLRTHVPGGQVSLRPLAGLGQLAVEHLRIAGARVDVAVDRDGAIDVPGLPAGVTWVDERRAAPAPVRVPAQEARDAAARQVPPPR